MATMVQKKDKRPPPPSHLAQFSRQDVLVKLYFHNAPFCCCNYDQNCILHHLSSDTTSYFLEPFHLLSVLSIHILHSSSSRTTYVLPSYSLFTIYLLHILTTCSTTCHFSLSPSLLPILPSSLILPLFSLLLLISALSFFLCSLSSLLSPLVIVLLAIPQPCPISVATTDSSFFPAFPTYQPSTLVLIFALLLIHYLKLILFHTSIHSCNLPPPHCSCSAPSHFLLTLYPEGPL